MDACNRFPGGGAMRSSRYVLLIALLLLSSAPSVFCRIDPPSYTLQVASFPDPDQAKKLLLQLIDAGEQPICSTVELAGRGEWTRVYLGIFSSADAAQKYGASLLGRGIIREFFVRKAEFDQNVTRPRKVSDLARPKITNPLASSTKENTGSSTSKSTGRSGGPTTRGVKSLAIASDRATKDVADCVSTNLPYERTVFARLAPTIDTTRIPRPDPLSMAFKIVNGDSQDEQCSQSQGCGLWIMGDISEGLARLKWIVGDENAGVLRVEADGRVSFDLRELERNARLSEDDVEDPMRAVNYISSNEGLLLLAQVVEGRHRYLLHIGRQTPTSGKSIETLGSVNLDNNIDSRINPYRKNGKKLDSERPPAGFDSLIGLNPVARWYNLSTSSWVQTGEIVFHELAEAYAKLEFGLDYLDHGTSRGAHNQALIREGRLKSQRPAEDIVVTAGSNRLLRSEEEIRLFYAEAAGGNQR
jgi:hypothetical protein